MEPECLLVSIRTHHIPCPEPDKSSPQTRILFFDKHLNTTYYIPLYVYVLSMVSFLHISQRKQYINILSFPMFDTSRFNHWTCWRSRLRHCTTARKVADSIPKFVIGIIHCHNRSGRTVALRLTQPLTEMSTRNISWGEMRPVRRAHNLTTFMCRLSWNLVASISWNPQDLSRAVQGLLYLYITMFNL